MPRIARFPVSKVNRGRGSSRHRLKTHVDKSFIQVVSSPQDEEQSLTRSIGKCHANLDLLLF